MEIRPVFLRFRFMKRAARVCSRQPQQAQKGQALVETVMATGFLVAIAMALNGMLRPVVLEAFQKIAKALSSVGP